MTDSQIVDKVGKIELGRKFDLSVLAPDFLWIAVMWAIFQISGKWPISNKLLNNLDNEKDIGVEMKCINFPGMPQCDKYDCLIFLIILATSIGEVFKVFKLETPSFLCKFGTRPWTRSNSSQISQLNQILWNNMICCLSLVGFIIHYFQRFSHFVIWLILVCWLLHNCSITFKNSL